MRPRIRIAFRRFWPGFVPEDFARWFPFLADRYDLQDPAAVSAELAAAAATIAADFDAVPDDAWTRPGRRSNGSLFTVASLGVYFLHDVLHHLHDVAA